MQMDDIDRSAEPLASDQLVLETERLILRPFGMDDLPLGVALFTNKDVVKYVCDVSTREEIEEHLPTEMKRGAGDRIGIWAATRKDTGAAIGTCILLPLPVETDDTDWSLLVADRYPDAEIEVGYLLLPEAWGKGFATEMCQAMLRFGFDHTPLAEIKATTDPENAASQHVLRKCGLVDEGMRRAYATECSGFGITRDRWLALYGRAASRMGET